MYLHEKLLVTDFIDMTVSHVEPVKPPPVESTSFKLVPDVDLEHNHYRSFQGLTCLVQISTRMEDFIVDTLKLRVQIGPYLREVFNDPTKRKVMHGADRDIIWLQRDFGLKGVKVGETLEYLVKRFCDVASNKEYQNADWRLRPLTGEMLRYAREDTHYLLYIYDLMKRKLLSSSTYPNCPEASLVEVYQRSYDLCMQLYQKEIMTENSYLNIYGDIIARSEDESTSYILPNKVLIEIAKQMPVTTGKLRHLLKSRHP
ncbi:putative ribonuclease D, HRDC-like superfamily, ribonuclease H-like superfamily [Helianthus annuus]|uniref:Ribonuclease D, HRDC-like superfamily, ribonuclease H-like superfamily n=1 Tax=Helianthus annuus TaxID=4232 RepID=A0A9K3J6E9_HELAN|nr:putative ribonuclease D, HRDC-like superfamily, ribonuclease H-like superfamily [Helianthus annuus]